jgi:hypothetical protein
MNRPARARSLHVGVAEGAQRSRSVGKVGVGSVARVTSLPAMAGLSIRHPRSAARHHRNFC